MIRTRPASGMYRSIENARNIAQQVGFYYQDYGFSDTTDPVFSDPYADYGGLGNVLFKLQFSEDY